MKRAAAGAVALGLSTLSCWGEPRIDTSSEEVYARSYEEVRSALPFDDRFLLDTAVIVVSFEDLDVGDDGLAGRSLHWSSAAEWIPGAMDRLHGLTASEVLRLGDSLRAAPASAWRRGIEVELADLEARRASAAEAHRYLAAFTVDHSSIHVEPGTGAKEVIIELTVTNGTPETVSYAYFDGSLQSDGRDEPWVDGAFDHRFEPELPPGASTSVSIPVNGFGDWRLAAGAPSYALLTVHVTRLKAPDGQPLFGDGWDETDEARLEALRRALR